VSILIYVVAALGFRLLESLGGRGGTSSSAPCRLPKVRLSWHRCVHAAIWAVLLAVRTSGSSRATHRLQRRLRLH